MDFIKTTGFFESTAGDGEKKSCKYYIYEPENHKSNAIVQISHGMCEYIERYEEFAELLVAGAFWSAVTTISVTAKASGRRRSLATSQKRTAGTPLSTTFTP